MERSDPSFHRDGGDRALEVAPPAFHIIMLYFRTQIMRSSISLLVLVGALLLTALGCEEDPVGPIGPSEIAFDLTIPPNRPAADLYAVSGAISRTTTVRVGDSIVESTISSFYAQFHTAPGIPLPASVLLNNSTMERNRGGDTLRLDDASATSVLGNNTWKLVDELGAADSFLMQRVDVLDTVGPFKEKKTFRSDTSLSINWLPPRLGSSGLFMIWKAPDTTLTLPLADVGFFTISKEDMKAIRGKGKVTFLRYLNSQKNYKGRKLILTRLAEHRYDVTVD